MKDLFAALDFSSVLAVIRAATLVLEGRPVGNTFGQCLSRHFAVSQSIVASHTRRLGGGSHDVARSEINECYRESVFRRRLDLMLERSTFPRSGAWKAC